MTDVPEMEYEPIADGEGLQVPPDIEPVEFLMAIYRDPRQPMNRRMKAAIEAGAIPTAQARGDCHN